MDQVRESAKKVVRTPGDLPPEIERQDRKYPRKTVALTFLNPAFGPNGLELVPAYLLDLHLGTDTFSHIVQPLQGAISQVG